MKVEYPLHLFNNFNKQIWTNKIFSYFLIVIIIGYTIGLRNYPEIYYKYLYNPLILLILICYILLIAKYNIPLGFMLTFSIIVLYYPKIKTTNNSNIMETFENENENENENEDEKINVPIYGEDKNIVDDTKKKNKNKKEKVKEIKIAEDFKDKDEDEDEEDDEDEVKKERFKEDDDEVKEIGLEKLNPGYYKNKNNTNKSSKSKSIKDKKNEKEQKNEKDKKDKKDKESQPQPKKESETFIGDVRQVIKDLDTGRGGMNASNAIKQINNLFYDKHKLNIKKIIENDDDSEEESDDDDFF